MENKILDFEEKELVPKYANKSFWSLLLAIGCFAIMVYSNYYMLSLRENAYLFDADTPVKIIIISFIIGSCFSIAGLVTGLKSIRINESSTFKKYTGTIGNLLILLILIFSIIKSH